MLFDFHGVLTDASPWDAFAAAGGDADPAVVLELFVGDYGSDSDHPWHQLERGEITMSTCPVPGSKKSGEPTQARIPPEAFSRTTTAA